jgi:CubicO group peptidase (beta-lactamase class C family)|tara:strand:- start:3287 stop:4519 length:1233 start_codon:yes stop_codon:yes gene_type:complete
MSSERLTQVSAWLEAQVSSERLAGASLAIARRGQIVYQQTAGVSDQGTGQAFADDTIVRIFSMTKPITTVAAMMLYERGCFQLDHPVARYIPAFEQTQVWLGGDLTKTEPQTTRMTVRQLMTHTSGLTYGFMNQNVVDADYRTRGLDQNKETLLADWVDELAEVPLICQPGTEWHYSVSTDVLGRLVEIWSGQSLAEFFEQEIFGPLGMQDTGFAVPEDQAHRFSSLYRPASGAVMGAASPPVDPLKDRDPGLLLLDAVATSPYLRSPRFYSGGGGLVSTMGDYCRFCQMLMDGGILGQTRLLSPKTIEYMRLNQLPNGADLAAMGQAVWSETNYEGIGFGIGWAVVIDPVKANIVASVGEHHWGGAASTFFWLDPKEELFVVFLTQLLPSSTYPLRRELRAQVYQALLE